MRFAVALAVMGGSLVGIAGAELWLGRDTIMASLLTMSGVVLIIGAWRMVEGE